MRLTPLTRTLFGLAVLAAVVAWANCQLVFPLDPPVAVTNTFFEGCFEGAITDPPAGGKLKIVLQKTDATDGLMLEGCLDMALTSGQELATFTGNVESEPELATLMAVRTAGGDPFTFRVARQPPGNVVASTVDLSNFSGAPFILAPGMARCVQPTTCEDLGIVLPFMPGGAP